MKQATIEIDGMSCGHCVAAVRNALENVAGVSVKNVAIGEATVSYDPAVVDAGDLSRAVTESGYPARVAGAE